MKRVQYYIKYARQTKLPATRAQRAAPLHCKQVGKIDYEAVRRMARAMGPQHLDELNKLLAWNLDASK